MSPPPDVTDPSAGGVTSEGMGPGAGAGAGAGEGAGGGGAAEGVNVPSEGANVPAMT
jgi:hypothetical protein